MLIISFVPSIIIRLREKNIWLFCERPNNAQDNGWIFFQWVRQKHPEQNVYFVLDKSAYNFDSSDRHFIAWGGFRHYCYYWTSNIYITSVFTKPKPNNRVCNYLEKMIKKRPQTMYLRHGICQHGLEEHLYKFLKVRLFVCGARKEYQYFLENADYPQGYLQYTGFARFDDLLSCMSDGRYILIIPTWRKYLIDNDLSISENKNYFLKSIYFNSYKSLLNNRKLISFAKGNNYKIKFCLHAEFRIYEDLFKDFDPLIEIVDKKESIHELLLAASLVITDFSSVFFDVAYMQKPIIYYHFDLLEYRQKHFSEGYFSYANDGFGPIVSQESQLITQINSLYRDGKFIMPTQYLERVNNFFTLHDCNNCKRIYDVITKIINDDGQHI